MSNRRITIIALVVLCGIGAIRLVTSSHGPKTSNAAPSGAEFLRLTGVVRDFTADHPDFGLSRISGHVAGNVGLALDVDGNPAFVGGGFRVDRQWTDAFGRPIAPHRFDLRDDTGLCYVRPGIAVDGALILDNQARVDSFDSEVGRYGGANVEANALIATNSTRPEMLQNVNSSEVAGTAMVGPGGDPAVVYESQPNSILTGFVDTLAQRVPIFGASIPDDIDDDRRSLVVDSGEIVRIDEDLWLDRFVVRAGGRAIIEDDVRIVCTGEFKIRDDTGSFLYGGIELVDDATLELFLMADDNLIAGEVNHNTGDPRRCTINVVGSGRLYLRRKRCHVAAYISAPDGHLRVGQGAELYGSFSGESAHVVNQGVVHVDSSFMDDYVGPPDSEGRRGSDSNGRISSAVSFAEWFEDRLGSNISIAYTIALRRDADDVYSYATNRFFPVNGKLFGDDRGSRNALFTYDIDATFVHTACAQQFIEFTGDGDTWIFIDDDLVMDLGGVRPRSGQFVDVDRLGLEPDRRHRLRFLHARRQFNHGRFELRTNLPLETDGVMPTAGFD